MNAKDCLLQRRSCRKYKEEKIDRSVIREIVDLARFAPSWHNMQVVRFSVVDDEELKAKIANENSLGNAFTQKTINRAAAVVIVSCVTGLSGKDDGEYITPHADSWEMFDAGAAVQTFCLAAREFDVGTCIIGTVDAAGAGRQINLPEDQQAVCLVAMGYPEEWKSAPPRKEVDEILSFR